MSEPQDVYEASRADKLRAIEALGLDPWGGRFDGHLPIGEVLKLNADAPEALVTMGTAALGEEDADQAGGYFRRALERNPRNGRAWVGQGLAQMLSLDLAAAEASLAAGVQNMPTHVG